MQPLQKKIKQSLKTKRKIMQPLGTKNDSTSRDKQKSHNLSGQKITQPLRPRKKIPRNNAGREKKSCNLFGQKKSLNL